MGGGGPGSGGAFHGRATDGGAMTGGGANGGSAGGHVGDGASSSEGPGAAITIVGCASSGSSPQTALASVSGGDCIAVPG